MKFKTVVATLLLIISAFTIFAQETKPHFDKSYFYDVIASTELEKVNSQLELLQASQIPEKEGFEGALLMKKAELISGLGKKLSVFKSGNEKLEKAIAENNNNLEFRFLRLLIQENAPKILGYNNEIEEDKNLIISGFSNLPPEVKEAVLSYSKKSKVLQIDRVQDN